MQDVLDERLHHFLRAEIRKLPINQQMQLKNLKMCGTTVMHGQIGVQPAVFLLRNNRNEAKFFGQNTCKNPWACPHCASIRMAKYGKEVGAAIDALWETHAAFMVTFTIPHLRYQSCREVTDILYLTWHDFFANAFADRGRAHTILNKFIIQHEIKHYVRCAEYTYGKNGWHPHFHVLFFTPLKYANDEILQWQNELNQRWLTCAKRVAEKYWQKNNMYTEGQSLKQRLDMLFVWSGDKNPALKISTTQDNHFLRANSSDYICGWGSDKELTGNRQKIASNPEHLTPYQILSAAADGDKNMRDLYIEFALQVTRKPVHHRVNFSKTGLKAIIQQHLNSVGYKEFMKKKQAEWELVCWFTQQQWQELSLKDTHAPVFSNILYLAAINKKDLLIDYLASLDIELVKSAHLHGQHVLNIFNNVA